MAVVREIERVSFDVAAAIMRRRSLLPNAMVGCVAVVWLERAYRDQAGLFLSRARCTVRSADILVIVVSKLNKLRGGHHVLAHERRYDGEVLGRGQSMHVSVFHIVVNAHTVSMLLEELKPDNVRHCIQLIQAIVSSEMPAAEYTCKTLWPTSNTLPACRQHGACKLGRFFPPMLFDVVALTQQQELLKQNVRQGDVVLALGRLDRRYLVLSHQQQSLLAEAREQLGDFFCNANEWKRGCEHLRNDVLPNKLMHFFFSSSVDSWAQMMSRLMALI